MSTPSEYPHTPSSSDIVSVVAKLARLTQHALSGGTPGSHEAPAQRLLALLLHLHDMQRGALLLVLPYHVEPQQSSWSALASREMLRTLARQGINDDELIPLLATFADHQDEEHQTVLSDQGWIICQQVIPAPNGHYYGESSEACGALFPSPVRFFVFGETEKQTLSRQAMVKKAQALWSQVADVVGTVIMSLLQAERMFELETVARHRDLQQMELLKAELLATVSHELRSPLTSIKGYTATLLRHERRISQEERHEFLIAIQDASQRLEVVVDRLLEVSQLETATMPLKRVSLNLVSLAREAVTDREQGAGRKETSGSVLLTSTKCSFVLHIEEGHGSPTNEVLLFQADQRLLRKVLDHLLENAVLYSPAGGKVEVGLRTLEAEQAQSLSQSLAQTPVAHRSTVVFPPSWSADQPMAEIWIQDHGIGISDEHLERIFQRFYRVDTSLTRIANGLGLGLAICKQIVELHEGILWAESEVGKGTTFHVLLPLKREG